MRKMLIVPLVAGALGFGLLVPRGTSAAVKPPVRYAFAELEQENGYPPPKPEPGEGVTIGIEPSVTWLTSTERVEVQNWRELAKHLGIAQPDNLLPPAVARLKVLEKLSADGWEIMDRPNLDARNHQFTWTFRRKLP
jgi:hypothetical protein